MYRIAHSVQPKRVTDVSYTFDSSTHMLKISIWELRGIPSVCRANKNLYTFRCNKHMFEFPYKPDISEKYKKNFLKFNLEQIFDGVVCSYDHSEDGKNNFFDSCQRYHETKAPTTMADIKRIEQKIAGTPISVIMQQI